MKFPYTKHGLTINPVGEFVTLTYNKRHLIGEVKRVTYNHTLGCFIATVQHFNGKPWPIEPTVLSLTWIKQDTNPKYQPDE